VQVNDGVDTVLGALLDQSGLSDYTHEIYYSVQMLEPLFLEDPRVHVILKVSVVYLDNSSQTLFFAEEINHRYAYSIEAQRCVHFRIVLGEEMLTLWGVDPGGGGSSTVWGIEVFFRLVNRR
jgi:hypothetical protein